MTNKTIARHLKRAADLLEITGGNPFRTRAFRNAARAIDRLDEPATKRLEAGTLTDIPGVGKGLAADVAALVETGTFGLLDSLMAAIPPGLIDVMRVKGLGAKKVKQLWNEADVTSLDDLEHAAASGRLTELGGFGKKTQEKILANIALLKRYRLRRRYADVVRSLGPVLAQLRAADALGHIEVAGEVRRKCPTVGRVDVLVEGDADAIRAALADADLIDIDPASDQADLVTSSLLDGLPLHLHTATADEFGTRLWALTGSEAHVAAFTEAHGTPPPTEDEAAVYSTAGLPFIHPELREDRGEFALGDIPQLIEERDLRGTLHNHSTWSDGTHTIREMAEAARAMGLSYFGLCDHSQSLVIANGLSPERVYAQREEVDALNAEYADAGVDFRIFHGIESDILADGALDYTDEVLATFDLIVASIHQGFNMTEDEATARLITAVENPYTTILGHPTGRLLLSREGYPIDHSRVIDACAANGVSIELNANPYRLDIDWRYVEEAANKGVLISINPDAHSTDDLENTFWGVEVARKGKLTPAQCLNALPLADFAAWIEARRSRHP